MTLRLQAQEIYPHHGYGLRPAGRQRAWMHASSFRVAERCLPLTIANQWGWEVTTPATVVAQWNGESAARGNVRLTITDGPTGCAQNILDHFGQGIVTWQLPWVFRTPPGWGLYVRGPANAWTPGAVALDGVVETDWNPATFTMNWKVVDPARTVMWARGDVIALLIPVRLDTFDRGMWEAEVHPLEGPEHAEYHRWQQSRAAFNAGQQAGAIPYTDWQRDYAVGRLKDGSRPSEHRTRLWVPDPSSRG